MLALIICTGTKVAPIISSLIRVRNSTWQWIFETLWLRTGTNTQSKIVGGNKKKISLGAFHLSELTGQPIPIVIRISLLIKTNHPDQSNPKYYTQRRWFFAKPLEKILFRCHNVWSGRPVLTFGKRPLFPISLDFKLVPVRCQYKRNMTHYWPFNSSYIGLDIFAYYIPDNKMAIHKRIIFKRNNSVNCFVSSSEACLH